jgi:predicted alpha/beta hydrolase family esterase
MDHSKRQICILHGGTTYPDDESFRRSLAALTVDYDRLLYAPRWRNWLAEQLPDHDVLLPSMPNSQNARYEDWSLYFDKIMPYLRDDAVLIGHSLGGIFLAKYLTEHQPVRPLAALLLVAAPYDDETDESLGNFKVLNVSKLANAAHEIHLFHSKDDPVVHITELDKYRTDLPKAQVHVFEDKQHFNMSTFPELLALITVVP